MIGDLGESCTGCDSHHVNQSGLCRNCELEIMWTAETERYDHA